MLDKPAASLHAHPGRPEWPQQRARRR